MSDAPTQVDPLSPPALVLSYSTADPRPRSRRGRGFLSLILTFVVTGLGQAACGRVRRGVVWLAGSILFQAVCFAALLRPLFVPTLLVFVPLAIIWNLTAIVDAYLVGRRSDRNLLGSPWLRYLSGIFILAASLFAGRYGSPSQMLAIYARDHWCEGFLEPNAAMSPTIVPFDRVLCHKTIGYSRWSVVVIVAPIDPRIRYIKRIVGLPGETVNIYDDQIHINGAPVTPPDPALHYGITFQNGMTMHGPGCNRPITLGPDEYYVLGDNSPISGDSRFFPPVGTHQAGALPSSSIIGPVTYIYWPPARWRKLY